MADYRTKVMRAVRMAFANLGTLATPATFNLAQSSSFDFSTAEATSTSGAPLETTCIVGKQKKPKQEEGNVVQVELTLKAEDMPDLSPYDSVTFNSATWKIIPPVVNDGYLITCTVARSA